MAAKVVKWVSDLPHNYRILVRLPVAASLGPEPHTSNGWTIERKAFERPGYGSWEENSSVDPSHFDICFTFSFEGAIARYTSQIALDEISTKVCLVLFVVRANSNVDMTNIPSMDYSGRGWLFAEDQDGKIQALRKPSDLDELISESESFCADHYALIECIELLGRIEAMPDRERTKITNAIHWRVQSLADRSFTSSVVKLSIAIDAFLGDSDHERGLKNTIADRLSYLLGKNMAHRSEIAKKVREFYSLRSKIIHGDVTVLRTKQRELCNELQLLLDQALMKEIRHH